MTIKNTSQQIDDLIAEERWREARALIETELQKQPDSHWLLTQLAETSYEEKDYKHALSLLRRSRELLPDCPLTNWHLAGTLDALGYHAGAIRLYTWLLQNKKTPAEDPCWESVEWTDTLKTDCVFRIGLCFKHLDRKDLAAHCFLRYLDIFRMGLEGTYTIEDVNRQLDELKDEALEAARRELLQAADWAKWSAEAALPVEPPELNWESFLHRQEA
jgi:tetratricopeptide (TPR) repeat protein